MIKELKKQLDGVNKAIEVNNERRAQLAQRRTVIENAIEDIGEKIESAEAAKAEALRRFAQGIATETEVDKARSVLKSLQGQLEEQNELLAAINVEFVKTVDCSPEIMNATHMPNSFRDERFAAERHLWLAINEREVVKARKVMETTILRAYCSARKSFDDGTSLRMLTFRDFVSSLLDSSFCDSAREESKKYEPEILKEYTGGV